MCFAIADNVKLFFVLWVVIGVCQTVLLLLFPATARKIHIGWKSMWGINIDPDSPMLSNAALRFFGVLTAVLVTVGVFIMLAWENLPLQSPVDKK
jgi:hypothetical protein